MVNTEENNSITLAALPDKQTDRSIYCFRLWIFILALTALQLGSSTISAQQLDKKITCIPTSLLLSYFLDPKDYTIKAKQLPPDHILNPGDSYQILYEILTTTCSASCYHVKRHHVEHRAVLGKDRSRLAKRGVALGKSLIQRHECGGAHSRVFTFVVPDIGKLGQSDKAVVSVSMGVCPPDIQKFNCAGHTIRVRNQSVPNFRVSAPKSLQRNLSGGPSSIIIGKPVTLSVTVTGDQSVRRWPQAGLKLVLRQIQGSRLALPGAQPFAGHAGKRSYRFKMQIMQSGNYSFNACIVGLKKGDWPAPDLCGPRMRLTAIGKLTRPVPQPEVNSSSTCTGGRHKSANGRCICPAGTFWNSNPGFNRCYRCTAGRVWNRSRRRCVIR